MKLGKAPRHDELTIKIVMESNTERKNLLNIFNQIKREWKPQFVWQVWFISSIYKKINCKYCKNYRGTTLGSIVGKGFRRIWENRV